MGLFGALHQMYVCGARHPWVAAWEALVEILLLNRCSYFEILDRPAAGWDATTAHSAHQNSSPCNPTATNS